MGGQTMPISTPSDEPNLSATQDSSLNLGTENLGTGNDIPFMGYIGGAFVVGMSVGYFSKKALKLTLFLCGMAIVSYLVLVYNHLLPELDPQLLTDGANEATNHIKNFGEFVLNWLSSVDGRDVGGVGVGATAGFFIGWKIA